MLGLALIAAGVAAIYLLTTWTRGKNMSWPNALRRWLGRPEVPLATSGETSVLFVLQSHSPKTLTELSEATNISEDQLAPLLAKLGRGSKARIRRDGSLYWAKKENK